MGLPGQDLPFQKRILRFAQDDNRSFGCRNRIHMLIDAQRIGSVGAGYLPSAFESRAILARTSATLGWSSASAFFHRSANFM
jgi:hypothetical protein